MNLLEKYESMSKYKNRYSFNFASIIAYIFFSKEGNYAKALCEQKRNNKWSAYCKNIPIKQIYIPMKFVAMYHLPAAQRSMMPGLLH
jgi:hypothetical protein